MKFYVQTKYMVYCCKTLQAYICLSMLAEPSKQVFVIWWTKAMFADIWSKKIRFIHMIEALFIEQRGLFIGTSIS